MASCSGCTPRLIYQPDLRAERRGRFPGATSRRAMKPTMAAGNRGTAMAVPDAHAITAAVQAQRDTMQALFDQLRQDGLDEPGVSRDPYGAGEQRAHATVAKAAEAHGAGNRPRRCRQPLYDPARTRPSAPGAGDRLASGFRAAWRQLRRRRWRAGGLGHGRRRCAPWT